MNQIMACMYVLKRILYRGCRKQRLYKATHTAFFVFRERVCAQKQKHTPRCCTCRACCALLHVPRVLCAPCLPLTPNHCLCPFGYLCSHSLSSEGSQKGAVQKTTRHEGASRVGSRKICGGFSFFKKKRLYNAAALEPTRRSTAFLPGATHAEK
jgi:hypothetical protein